MKHIPLTRGQFAIVDDSDYEPLNQFNWYALKSGYTFYVYSQINAKLQYVHRLIMDAPQDRDVDHINRNGLDNRRSNLRLCSRSENLANAIPHKDNKSGFKGVSYYTGHPETYQRKRWQATIGIHGKMIFLGYFATPKKAALAYNKAAVKHFGEFARLNNLDITERAPVCSRAPF